MAKLHLTNDLQSVFQSVESAAKKKIHSPYTYRIETSRVGGTDVVVLHIFKHGDSALRSINFNKDTTYKGARKKIGNEFREEELAA